MSEPTQASFRRLNYSAWQWLFLALGAFVTGLTKTGVPGLGVLSVALFANAISARESTGALLPLMLCADVFGLFYFRKHAVWSHLWRLFPWVMLGIMLGYLALGHWGDLLIQRLIGAIIVAMVALNVWRRLGPEDLAATVPHTAWFSAVTGIIAGFATMVANAAGPIMTLYLLALGLPKMSLIGTGAWFFMLVNAIKVPFSVQLGLITPETLKLDAWLILPMLPGAWLGPVLLKHINQTLFEMIALTLAVVASVRLLWG